MNRPFRATIAMLAFLAWPSSGLAQTTTYAEKKTADGQGVVFDDDPLGALDGQPIGQQLWGFPRALRCDLMRPRTHEDASCHQ